MERTAEGPDRKKTVLVVDDDAGVLSFVFGLLVTSHYNVLSASSGAEALMHSRDYKGDIDLLLSDFQMPGMNGMDLATQMVLERPQLKVLLMSGFVSGMLVLNEGWHFLAKPFIPSQLRALIAGLLVADPMRVGANALAERKFLE